MIFNWPINNYLQQQLYLQKQIKSGRINHAYLYIGRDEKGILDVTLQFVKSLICINKNQPLPCNQCINCKKINKNIYSDLEIIVPSKKNIISIGEIRSVIQNMQKKSLLNSWHISIITQAHLLTQSACNALLKNLEELNPKKIIILIANNSAKLPKTILSRCQIIKFINSKRIQADFSKKIINKVQNLIQVLSEKKCNSRLIIYEKKFKIKDNLMTRELILDLLIVLRDSLLIKNNQIQFMYYKIFHDQIKLIADNYSELQLRKLSLYIQDQLKKEQNTNWKLVLDNILINL